MRKQEADLRPGHIISGVTGRRWWACPTDCLHGVLSLLRAHKQHTLHFLALMTWRLVFNCNAFFFLDGLDFTQFILCSFLYVSEGF